MTFDKEAYWANRKKGFRGQGATDRQLIREARRKAIAEKLKLAKQVKSDDNKSKKVVVK